MIALAILRRLLVALVTLAGVAIVVFILLRVVPGDPIAACANTCVEASIDRTAVAARSVVLVMWLSLGFPKQEQGR